MNNRLMIAAVLVLGIAMFSLCAIPGMADADSQDPASSTVATIGDTEYTDLATALAAAMGTTATIEITADAEISTNSPGTPIVTVPEGTKLTINLNGHTLTSNTRLLKIDQNSNDVEIIINAGIGGKIDVGTQRVIANICSSYTEHINAKVTVNGGEYRGDYPFMLYNLEQFTMTNATIIAPTSGIWLGNLGVQNLTLSNVTVTTSADDATGIYLGTVKNASMDRVIVDSACTALEIKSGTVSITNSAFIAGQFEEPNGFVDHDGSGFGKSAMNINNGYCREAGVNGVNVTVSGTSFALKNGTSGKTISIANDESRPGYSIDVTVAGKTLADVAYSCTTEDVMKFNGQSLNALKGSVSIIYYDPELEEDVEEVETAYFATFDDAMAVANELLSNEYVEVEAFSIEPMENIILPSKTVRVLDVVSFVIKPTVTVEIPANSILQVDGMVLCGGIVDNKGSIDLNGTMLFTGNKAKLMSSGILAVKGTLAIDEGATASIDNSIKARNNATLIGTFNFGEDNTIKFLNTLVGQGGLVVEKGSIKISGQLRSGNVELKGQIDVVDNLNIGTAEVKVLADSNMAIPEDVTLSSENGGYIVNKGNISIYGAVSSSISNTGKVNVIGDAAFTGGYVGDQSNLNVVPFQIKKLSRMTFEPGQAVRISLDNVPSEANLSVKMSNASTCWLTITEDGKALMGTAPSRAEVYRVTVTATLGNYTDEMQFDVSVTAPTVEQPEEPEKKDATPWTLIVIALVILGGVAVVTKGRIW